jgi:putative effector of murein hydrolase
MITFHWTILILIVVVSYLIFRIVREETDGDYNFNFMPIIWAALIIVAILLYGGVFWW